MLDRTASVPPPLTRDEGSRPQREGGGLALLRAQRPDGGLVELGSGRCRLMAILNVTPDSFSDGGRYDDPGRAIARAHELVAEGAEIVDVGAESTRPGAELLTADEEWARLAEVVRALGRAPIAAALSIDTRHVTTARRAAEAGFSILNLTFPQHLVCPTGASDGALAGASKGAVEPALSPSERRALLGAFDAVVLMHSRGLPATMRQLSDYGRDLCQTVVSELSSTVHSLTADEPALAARLILDPGLGFAKTAEQSLRLLAELPRLKALLGTPILVGASRKSMLGTVTGLPVGERLVPSVVAAALAARLGADVVRVHDVAATRAALELEHAVRASVKDGPRACPQDAEATP